MARIVPLAEAVAEGVRDGDTVAFEGFTHGLPFAVLRGYAGTDLAAQTATVRAITCPFTGETRSAVEALRLDAAVIHAQRADWAGNVQFWGITGVQKEAVL